MNKSDLQLWEILIPRTNNDGEAIPYLTNQLLGDFIVAEAGGYTFPNQTVQGFYLDDHGDLITEPMMKVQIAANLETMSKIACFIKTTLKQESVMFYQVSPLAFFV